MRDNSSIAIHKKKTQFTCRATGTFTPAATAWNKRTHYSVIPIQWESLWESNMVDWPSSGTTKDVLYYVLYCTHEVGVTTWGLKTGLFISKGCISGTNITFGKWSDNDWTWPDNNFPFIAYQWILKKIDSMYMLVKPDSMPCENVQHRDWMLITCNMVEYEA